jgi:phage I-like protein
MLRQGLRSLRLIALAVAIGDAPPTEFRIFKAGENTTSHGTFLFDDQAAIAVMEEYNSHGIDVMIDLEHLSVEDPETSANFDPDARGWCKLELRNGELWAVNVTWTTDGTARLTEKRQRYISPVFAVDAETKRIMAVLNIAITAIPATDNLAPLVAASRRARDLRKLSAGVSFNDVAFALSNALMERFPYAYICDIYDASIVYEFEGKLFEVAYTFDGATATLAMNPVEVKRTYSPVGSTPPAPTAATRRQKLNATEGDTTMTPDQLAKLAEVLGLGTDANVEDVIATVGAMVKKVQDAANGTAPANDSADNADPAAAKGAAPMVAAARMLTASRVLVRLSGKKEIGEQIREVEAWQKSHVELEQRKTREAAERVTLEASERHRLVGELVKLGAEIPATAWADDDAKKPAEPWASMPIEQLRDRVAKRQKASGVPPTGSLTTRPHLVPPVGGGSQEGGAQTVVVNGGTVELSAFEVQACKDAGTKLEDYAKNKIIRARASTKTRNA